MLKIFLRLYEKLFVFVFGLFVSAAKKQPTEFGRIPTGHDSMIPHARLPLPQDPPVHVVDFSLKGSFGT